MHLRGIDFGHVLDASGARGWFGEGYAYHKLIPFGLSFEGSTFVAKTTTLDARKGNAILRADGLTPRIAGQRCVTVNWRKGVALNAFGLSGPGFRALAGKGEWQKLRAPFFLSFMSIEETADASLREVETFVDLLRAELPAFRAPVGLQVNFSCPNVQHLERVSVFLQHLDAYQSLGIPIVPKISVTLAADAARAIHDHPATDAICISNTIPWGELPDRVDWKQLFGEESPLREFGGGGLSGAPLLPIVADWLRDARSRGWHKPINAGGGVLGPSDADTLLDSGASSIFVGSIAMLRGWRLARTIRHANRIFSAADAQARSGVRAA